MSIKWQILDPCSVSEGSLSAWIVKAHGSTIFQHFPVQQFANAPKHNSGYFFVNQNQEFRLKCVVVCIDLSH